MVAASGKFVEHSEGQNGRTKWHGCVNHLLELITGIAFTDAPKTIGTISACHSIVNFYYSSTQAMSKLPSKQVQGRAVKPIQDVVTRWWSTYSIQMVEWLLRLKMFLAILQEEGDFTGNFSEDQWKVAADQVTFATLHNCIEAVRRRVICYHIPHPIHGLKNQEMSHNCSTRSACIMKCCHNRHKNSE
jgi:hypothetical protein